MKMHSNKGNGTESNCENNCIQGISGFDITNMCDDVKVKIKHEPVENCWGSVHLNNDFYGEGSNNISRVIGMKQEAVVKTKPEYRVQKSAIRYLNGVKANTNDKLVLTQGITNENINIVYMTNILNGEIDKNVNGGMGIKRENYITTEPYDSKAIQCGFLKLGLDDFNSTNSYKDVKIEIKYEPVDCDTTDEYRENLVLEDTNIHKSFDLELKQKCHILTEQKNNDIDNEVHANIEGKLEISQDPIDEDWKYIFGEKLYQCNKAFFEKYDKKPYNEDNPHQCSPCGKAFISKDILISHLMTHFEKYYQCHYCDKTFISKKERLRHMVGHTKDSGEKVYKCNQCKKVFSNSGNLGRHKKTHTGDKPYKCSDCNKAFFQRYRLVKHRLTHTYENKPINEGKPHQCSHCDKAFISKNILIKHLSSHSEKYYRCHYCNKNFTCENEHLRHMVDHTGDGEKKYKCNQCKQNFSSSNNLGRHMMIHMGDKPYQCSDCNQAFFSET